MCPAERQSVKLDTLLPESFGHASFRKRRESGQAANSPTLESFHEPRGNIQHLYRKIAQIVPFFAGWNYGNSANMPGNEHRRIRITGNRHIWLDPLIAAATAYL